MQQNLKNLERFLGRNRPGSKGAPPHATDLAEASRDVLSLLRQFKASAHQARAGERRAQSCLGDGGFLAPGREGEGR